MCGILSIISTKGNAAGGLLTKACTVIKHRGPDDEGFLTWAPGSEPQIWAGDDTAAITTAHWRYNKLTAEQPFKVGFGHRRLSILDLSPAGHQPMTYGKAGLAITFNGEIYNYLEIKAELVQLGHVFVSTSDTEVILHAWEEWGVQCLDRFNGMFAFVLLDHHKNELFAVRDRFGVKPLFYYHGADTLYLASEIKQVRTAPGYKLSINQKMVRQYLATGAVDHTVHTFDTEVKHLPCGHYIHMDLSAADGACTIKKWYELVPKKWTGTYDAAAAQMKTLLIDAVNLRLRSDVTVGSCLSGGLDSSSIVCIAADLLKAKGDFAGLETVTACYDSAQYDEWHFAQEVIQQTGAHPHRTFPSFGQLMQEVEAFIWHQDDPTGSTSQFSQWAVFKKTYEAGLKVMVDGQGADEQLAGYGGNDVSYYTGLVKKMQFAAVLDEAKAYKKEKGHWPAGFLIHAVQLATGISGLLPAKLRIKEPALVPWLVNGEPSGIYKQPAASLQENLLKQLYMEPLPALLRYEDHNSMAWSVESRTPFMDYRLVEFTLGLPERFIYRHGVRKTILRDAMRTIIPQAISNRRDKMGFVTPEELWLKGEGKEWFLKAVDDTCTLFKEMIDATLLKKEVNDIIDGKKPFSPLPWRVASLGIWYRMVTEGSDKRSK